MWDQRYGSETYVYGTEPNDFLVGTIGSLPKGKILCLGEGEGRNATWLAQQGFEVTAVDGSAVGLQKAQRLARSRGVNIEIVHADLANFEIRPVYWAAIVSIFCHLPPELRRSVHRRCVEGLITGGVMLLEAYTPLQLEYKTGGPPTADMMMDSKLLGSDFDGLEIVILNEIVREVGEGEFHSGDGAVVQLLARKP